MKKILLLSTILAGSFLIYKPADAQFRASVDFGVQSPGYDYAENYYLPDAEAYYCVPRHEFVYFDNGSWVFSPSLPGRCENFNAYSGYRVAMNEHNPWFHFNDHRLQYAGYRSAPGSVVFGDNRGYYGRPIVDDRNRGRDYGYNRRDNYDHRQDWSRNNDHYRGGYNNERRHDDDHGGRGRGRW